MGKHLHGVDVRIEGVVSHAISDDETFQINFMIRILKTFHLQLLVMLVDSPGHFGGVEAAIADATDVERVFAEVVSLVKELHNEGDDVFCERYIIMNLVIG